MNTLLLRTPHHLLGFFGWWAYLMPIRIFHYFEDFLSAVDGNLKFGANLKLWLAFEPLFGDYGWRGRLVGFLFRTLRALVTLLVYIAIFCIAIASIIMWYLLIPLSFALIFGLI